MTDRTDRMLEEALRTGQVPPGASDEEREELMHLLRLAADTRSAGGEVQAEAGVSMPVARARFERFVTAQPAAGAAAKAKPRRGGVSGFFLGRGGLLTGAASAAAAVAIVVFALFLTGGTESAAAQVLTAGDYVQVQGTVTGVAASGDTQLVSVRTPFKLLTVEVSPSTAVIDPESSANAPAIKQGDSVLVGGLVATDTARVTASTVALSKTAPPLTQNLTIKRLQKLKAALQGRVLTFTVAADGVAGQALIETATGERYLVRVDGPSVNRLLALASAFGTEVTVSTGSGSGANATFSLAVSPPAGAAGRSAGLVGVEGIVVAREGNVLSVRNRNGVTQVEVRPATRILPAESGLVREEVRKGTDAIIGHGIAVSGVLNPSTSHVMADVVVLGRQMR